jgi:hypothetical protein
MSLAAFFFSWAEEIFIKLPLAAFLLIAFAALEEGKKSRFCRRRKRIKGITESDGDGEIRKAFRKLLKIVETFFA